MDSINYAKYIQKALLPNRESIENFFENQFIFYLPKDIVGGDFYCFKSVGDKAVIVTGDCTGHGVPGGFGTMIGSLVIEKSLKKGLKDPNLILTVELWYCIFIKTVKMTQYKMVWIYPYAW